MRSILIAIALFVAIPPAFSAQIGFGGTRTNFDCDVTTKTCRCDGTFVDCESMGKNCEGGKVNPNHCITEKGKPVCLCPMPRVRVAPQNTAPTNQQLLKP